MLTNVFAALLAASAAGAVSITDIQGNAWLSPLAGQKVSNLTGIVTAKGPNGFWIQSEPSSDVRVSHGLNVYTTTKAILAQVAPGDAISLSGTVTDFRPAGSPNNLFASELTAPADIVVRSRGNAVAPLVLGAGGTRSPPTERASALDAGPDGWLSVPNNASRVAEKNAPLQPEKFGLDFWASLEGQLVTVRAPVALNFENSHGEFWVRGDWKVTGLNARGGLTITAGRDGIPDANPEVIMVGGPLDGSKNPKTALGTKLADITGVIIYQFGFWYILPLTTPTIVEAPPTNPAPTTLKTAPWWDLCTLTMGDYNVENMSPTSKHLPVVADHIANYLLSPDLMFVQEIQDNSGETKDGVVSGNVTLSTLTSAIANASKGATKYEFVEIAPVDMQDGGVPGGNIRTAYLYKKDKFHLVSGSPAGGALDATSVTRDFLGRPILSFNPGRIDPTNGAWNASRKPLVAHWETSWGARFYTINVHLASKGGSASSQGDARPPVNGGVDDRAAQVATIAKFVKDLLKKDPGAHIVLAGDCNEFFQTRSVYAPFAGLLTEADEAAGVPAVERYTYLFDQNSQQLDHMFVSDAVRRRGVKVEHVHVNNWAASYKERTSDHDPSVAQVKVCGLF